MKNYKSLTIATILLVLADQVTKWFSRAYLFDYVGIFPEVGLMHHENTGVAFSMPIPTIVTIPIAIVVGIFILYSIKNQKNPLSIEPLALTLILSGAIGNALDRIIFGFVTDFFVLSNFPIFNMADVYINIGILLIAIDLIKEIYKKKNA